MSDGLCHPYVWEDPRYLFHSLWNKTKKVPCASEIINQIIGIYILAIVIGVLLAGYTGYTSIPLFTGIAATIFLIPTFQTLQGIQEKREKIKRQELASKAASAVYSIVNETEDKKGVKEGFGDPSVTLAAVAPVNALRVREFNNTGVEGTLQTAKARNPFDNILIDQIKYEPNRPAAADITNTERKIELDELFRVQWFSDPTDVFGKTQSQRMFITQPVTTIPNDQDSYQKWLYKIPGKTCKEGGKENCYAGTEGAALPWLNM